MSSVFFFFLFYETEGRQTSVKAQDERIDHLASFSTSSREEISQPGIEPPTSSLKFRYLSTTIQ